MVGNTCKDKDCKCGHNNLMAPEQQHIQYTCTCIYMHILHVYMYIGVMCKCPTYCTCTCAKGVTGENGAEPKGGR